MKKKKIAVERLIPETYIAAILGSVGSLMFRHWYVRMNGLRMDAMKNGKRSCAFHVSSILTTFGFIKRIHGTVDATVEDMKRFGWVVAQTPKEGDVIVWQEKMIAGHKNRHIGFYVGGHQAVSNCYRRRMPVKHHWTFHGQRTIQHIFTYRPSS